MSPFKLGDKVRVVNYGHPQWNKFVMEDDKIKLVEGVFDSAPYLLGKIGIVSKVDKVQGAYQYALKGIPEKIAWYDEDQLELYDKKENTGSK